MKRFLFIFTLLILGLTSVAQRVDLDRFTFSANYRNLPSEPLDTSYKTYTVFLETGPMMRSLNQEDEFSNRVNISGWRLIPYDAHVRISLIMEDVMIENTEVKTNVQILKDKAGKEIGKKTTYQSQLTYSFGARSRITDYKGNLIKQEVIASRQNKRTHLSPVFQSEGEAIVYTRFGIITVLNELNKQVFTQTISNLSQSLTYRYGYPERSVSDFMWVLNSRKHPEFDGFQRAWMNVRQAMMEMSANEPLDNVREKLKPSIAYFNQLKKRYGSDDKSGKKILYACYFNLSKIYYYLDEPDMAMKEAGELVINGYDSKDGKQLEALSSDLKTILKQSKIKSRHFPVDIDSYKGPDMASKFSK
jgi:hypothetical protein